MTNLDDEYDRWLDYETELIMEYLNQTDEPFDYNDLPSSFSLDDIPF